MARGRNSAEAWMVTPDEVNFCPPIYPVRHIFSKKREGASEGFAPVKGEKWRRSWVFVCFFSLRAGCGTCLTS
jgi:hypothetical protein